MRWTRNLRVAAVLTAGVLGLTACGGSSGQPAAQTKGGSPIVVASFNFTDSQILAELYAKAKAESPSGTVAAIAAISRTSRADRVRSR